MIANKIINMKNEAKINYNSSYINLKLIDELDYVIGGYSKPNVVFIYSLNAFLEAFILNSTFYISEREARHLQLLSKSIFPNGRPILELLAKSQVLKAMGGIGNDIGIVTAVRKLDLNNPIDYQEAVKNFLNNGIDTNLAREKYLTISSIDTHKNNNLYLNVGKVSDGLIATDHTNNPIELYEDFLKVDKHSNIQAVLPYYSFSDQVEITKKRGVSKGVMAHLNSKFNNIQDIVEIYSGYSYQSIPPLVSILLSQCANITEIPNKILQLREDFVELRTSIIKYEQRINEAESIKEQFDAIKEIDEF